MINFKQKTILVCPLDWGLGHASRCIPVIRELLKRGQKVIIGADNYPLVMLREEFPELEWVKIPGCNIVYSSGSFMSGAIIKIIPAFIRTNAKEHKLLQDIIEQYKIDLVISDNRYGLWSRDIPSVIITHQLKIRSNSGFRWIEPFLHNIIINTVEKFTFCWVPDLGGQLNLAGALAHHYAFPDNARLIGPLSRFSNADIPDPGPEETPYELMAVISGPEPQRTIFENIIINQFDKSNLKSLIVRGKPGNNEPDIIQGNIRMVNHLPTPLMKYHMINCGILICRPGYSSIMDLAALNKNAILIPTPGQTEQVYLAARLKTAGVFYSMPQKAFRLSRAIDAMRSYRGPEYPEGSGLLAKAMDELFKIINR